MDRALEAQVTVLIKTFERRDLLLRLHGSIRRAYPQLRIVIVDDSRESLPEASFDACTDYFATSPDVGLSHGRNLGVERISTPYFVLCDDDYVFTPSSRVERLLETLGESGADLVGGLWRTSGGRSESFEGALEIAGATLFVRHGRSQPLACGARDVDFCNNFFLMSTSLARECPWDSRLKLMEHIDFFLRLKEKGKRVVVSDDVSVDHRPDSRPHYQALRFDRRRLDSYRRTFLERRNLQHRIDVWGSPQGPTPDRSIVIPIDAPDIDANEQILRAQQSHPGERLELLFVDRSAASPSLEAARALAAQDSRVRVCQFSLRANESSSEGALRQLARGGVVEFAVGARGVACSAARAP